MESRSRTLTAGGIIAAATLAAYHGIFRDPFVYLDVSAIQDNPTIRRLWPIGPVLHPPVTEGLTVGGRPFLNLSFAINYALGGANPWGYHAVNLAIHSAAALVLFGIVGRTLASPVFSDRRGFRDPGTRTLAAFLIALIWAVHPLDTESVAYVVQRAESLMGMLYLLTLYCFIREATLDGVIVAGVADPGRPASARLATGDPASRPQRGRLQPRHHWLAMSWVACLLGMATKEVMVSAPVMVFLYDRTFMAGTFREAWRKRWGYYVALAATWLPLAVFVASTGGNRGGTAGLGIGVSWIAYLRTQAPALAHYLRLAVWPYPQVFYYAVHWTSAAEAAPYAVIVLVLAAGSAFSLFRAPERAGGWVAFGFAGAWFFAILAPTSLVPGMSQTLAEHRMYLPLAAVIAGIVLSAWSLAGTGKAPRRMFACAALGVAILLGGMTERRNRIYSSELALWSDTVRKVADNPNTQLNYGIALADAGRPGEAIDHFSRALILKPDYPEAWDDLGLALANSGRTNDAIGCYQRALKIKPDYPEALANLGVALTSAGRMGEAIDAFQGALRLDPGFSEARNNLAAAFAASGRLPEAIEQYTEALLRKPDSAETHYNLANALLETGRGGEAIGHYRRALELKPRYLEAHVNLGVALAGAGQLKEAEEQYEQALALSPDDPDIHYNLGLVLRSLGRGSEAEEQFSAAERLKAASKTGGP